MHRGKSIKCPRSDRGGKYLLGEFRQFLKDHGIISQKFAPGSLKHEGVEKRRNKDSLGYDKIIDELCVSS